MGLVKLDRPIQSFTTLDLSTKGLATLGKALSAFLSHSNLDESKVKLVQRFLAETGIKPWVSFDDIHNSDYDRLIARQIKSKDVFVLILSNNSAHSDNVQNECAFADANKKKFVIYELEVTDIPEGLALRLSRKQRVLAHKFSEDSLERLARLIIQESGLSWSAYSDKAKEAESRIRQQQQENELRHRQNLGKYKELYWNCRTRNGKYRTDAAIAVIDREKLARAAAELGLTDEVIGRIRSEFDGRKKADFTFVLSKALATKSLTIEDLHTLETKRLDCCVSRIEVERIINAKNSIPTLKQKRWPGLQLNPKTIISLEVDWITELLKCKKVELDEKCATVLNSSAEPPVDQPRNAISPSNSAVIQHHSSSVSLKEPINNPQSSESERNSLDIQVVKVRAAYRGRGKNDDFLGLEEIKNSQDSSSNLDARFILHVTSKEASNGLTRIIIASLAGDEEKLYVKIPSNIKSGTQLRLQGKGHKAPSMERGDLFLKIKVYNTPLENVNKPNTTIDGQASTGISQSVDLRNNQSSAFFPEPDNRKSDSIDLGQDGFPQVGHYGVAKTFECSDGFMVITEIYLGNQINRLSVRRIDIEKSNITFYGVSEGRRQNVIKTTRAFKQILVQRNKIYFKQDGFKNLIKGQVDSVFEDYSRLLEFLRSSFIPVKEIDEDQRDEINSITSSPQDKQPTFIWDWLTNDRNSTNATREVIHEQNSQKPLLDELSAFNLLAAIRTCFGKLDGIPAIKYGADISQLPAVRSAIKAYKLKNEKDLKTFFWYNESIIRGKRGIIVSNRGISLQSFFQNPTLFVFGRHGLGLSDNISISDQNNELRIEITGHTNTSTDLLQKTYVFLPAKEQRPLIAAALMQFVGVVDSYYSCMTRLRISLARELLCSIGYRNLSSKDAIIAFMPADQLSPLEETAKNLISMSDLPLPNDGELIFLLKSSPANHGSLLLATIQGLYAAKKIGKRLAKGVFIKWSLLHDFRFCSKNQAYHYFQINNGVDAFTISWLLVDGSKEDFEEIARFVMSLKRRLASIMHL